MSLDDSSSSSDDERTKRSRSMLQETMAEDSKLYEYLFSRSDDDNAKPPSVVGTAATSKQHYDDDDEFDSLFLPSIYTASQMHSRLEQTVRHQQFYIQNLERQVYEQKTRTPPTSSTMTKDASRRFLDVVQDIKTKHAFEMDEWKRKLVRLKEKQEVEIQQMKQERDELKCKIESGSIVETELQQAQERGNELLTHLEQCQSELQACREELAAERTSTDATKNQLEQCQQELLSLKEHFSLKETELLSAKNLLEGQLEGCQHELSDCREQLSAQDEANNRIISELESRNQLREEEIAKAHGQIQGLTASVKQSETALETTRNENQLLKSDLAEHRSLYMQECEKYERLERDMLKLQEEMNRREEQYSKELSQKELELAEEHKRRESLQEELSATCERLSECQAELAHQMMGSEEAVHPPLALQGQEGDELVGSCKSKPDQELVPVDKDVDDAVDEEDELAMITPICSVNDTQESSALLHYSLELGSSLLGLVRDDENNNSSVDEQEKTVLQQLEAMSEFLDRVDIHEYLRDSKGMPRRARVYSEDREEEEMVPLDMYLELQHKLELLEEERNILLAETLDLLESAREANVAEMDVFEKEERERTERRVKEQVEATLDAFSELGLKQEDFQRWREFISSEDMEEDSG